MFNIFTTPKVKEQVSNVLNLKSEIMALHVKLICLPTH